MSTPPLPWEEAAQAAQAKAAPLPWEEAAANAPRQSTDPEEAASQTRQMLVSGLTGMPTPNMTPADVASFNRGKAAGALSVPAIAGGTAGTVAGAAALPEAIGAAAEAAIPHVVALGTWAEANPALAKFLLEGLRIGGFSGALALINRLGK